MVSTLDPSKLNVACQNESTWVVATLLDSDSRQDQDADEEGRTAVHYACQNMKEGAAILKLLNARGFSLQALTKRGCSPLHEACRNGNNATAQFISGWLLNHAGDALFFPRSS